MSNGWELHLIFAAFVSGLVIGSFVRWGFDRIELAAYRRMARDWDQRL